MSKVLKITKADKTVHVVPVANKAFYLSYNNRLPQGHKWRIEEIDESQAKNLPFIDESFVTPLEAQAKLADISKQSEEKDKEIEALRAKLAEKPSTPPKFSAEMVISLIGVAATVEQVETLAKDDERVTVKAAAAKRIEEIKAA